ncbi:MAG: Rrf2 family transcriptional regulator [Nitrospinales bacterium]
MTNQQIAKVTKVPVSYLSKVLQALARAKIVRSQRGLHGGFVLARPANELSLLEIINAVDPIHRIERCPLDLEQHGTNLCSLHKRLNDSIMMIEKVFKESTIADLLSDSNPSKPLCDSPETRLNLEKA